MITQDWSKLPIDYAIADDVVASIRDAVTTALETGTLILRLKQCCEEPMFWRLEFGVRVGSGVLDRFANNRSGYRGHYFSSPSAGSDFNKRIVTEVYALLLSAVKAHPVGERQSTDALERSIEDAKIWPNESGVDSSKRSCTQWDDSNWSDNIGRFHELLQSQHDLSPSEIKEWMKHSFDENIRDFGPYQFVGEQLTIKGAFVRETEINTFIPKSKRFRPLQLHCFGAS